MRLTILQARLLRTILIALILESVVLAHLSIRVQAEPIKFLEFEIPRQTFSVDYRDDQQIRLAHLLNLLVDISVPAGGNVQAAINSAQRGDRIIISASVFNVATPDTGLVFPEKSGAFDGSNYIKIQTANLSSLSVARVSPADSPNVAKLVATLRGAPVMTIKGSGYWFDGIEITNNLSGDTSADITLAMVVQNGSNVVFNRTLIHPKEHPTLETKWITRGKFGFTVNGSNTTIQRSYCYDFFGRDPSAAQTEKGSAQQTECIYVSPVASNVTTDNNYLQSWYANMQTAGSDGVAVDPAQVVSATMNSARLSHVRGLSPNMVIAMDLPHVSDPNKCPFGSQSFDAPCYAVARVGSVDPATGDVTFTTPLVTKSSFGYRIPPYALPIIGTGSSAVWQGSQPTNISITRSTLDVPLEFGNYHLATNGNTGKGIIETKATVNFLFEGNIVTGFPSSLALTTTNQNCGAPWQTTAYTIIRNNWFQAYRTGVLASFTDYGCVSSQGHDLIVDNNLFNGGVSTGDFLRLSGPSSNITATHNTATGGFRTADGSTYTGAPWLAAPPSNGSCTSSATGGGTPCVGSQEYYPIAKATGVILRDNLTDAGNYTAICYDSAGNGGPFFNCFASPVQDHNMFVLNVPNGGNPFPGSVVSPSWDMVFVDPAGGNWRCAPTAKCYRAASDGKDIGVDFDRLLSAISGGVSPAPSPSPTVAPPSPSPTATPTPVSSPSVTPTPLPVPSPSPSPIFPPNISGTVTAGGSPLPDVVVRMLRAADRVELSSFTTKVSGGYSLNPTTGSSVVVSPQRAGFTFTPSEVLFSIISGARVQDFVAVPVSTPTPTPVTPSPSPTPSVPLPSPSPSATVLPTPEPPACTITIPESVSIPRRGSRSVQVTLNNLVGSGTITTQVSSGQVSVNPTSRLVNGLSASVSFMVSVKQNSGSVTFTTPCGVKNMAVVAQ